ncbi:hypothetical protein PEC301296_24100 [Pectobacterium carotovorum subsp. carotovorum]|nr:hypothetical protein GZ59_08600 [Pectobacterium atrosepticum]POW30028.1 hypothetical protein PB72LOC_01724 [Pectobacterium atrosepticum]GKV86098.1 hypothetical protein PEC301296_24100 [Pectobacterium carotovorum subsp. carotovorum]
MIITLSKSVSIIFSGHLAESALPQRSTPANGVFSTIAYDITDRLTYSDRDIAIPAQACSNQSLFCCAIGVIE